jgi:Xaa-Pro aminopeptidase
MEVSALRSDIDQILSEKGAEALLLVSESYKDANMYYLSKFLALDPFMLFKKVGSPPTIVISPMEFLRAKKESIVRDIRSSAEYNYFNIVKAAKDPQIGAMKAQAYVLEKEISKKPLIAVPQSFPALLADFLRSEGLNVQPFHNLVENARETKEPDEIEEMIEVQRVAEKVTSEIIEMIANCKVESNGTLTFKADGKKQFLTSGKIKSIMGHAFIDEGVLNEDPIVSCGPLSAIPHYSGEPDDKLKANQPIIMDIFPQSIRKRYTSDMTRTVVKGKAPKEIKKMFDTVLEARNASLDALHAGALGSDMFHLCCNVFEKNGYETIRGGKQIEKGFTHSLGHGVGLAVHESPGMGEVSKLPLKDHAVVTVEPGLYNPKLGGVRIEDIVEITKKGCRNLTEMPIQLEV